MDLYELAVRIACALLITSRGRAAGANHRIGRFAEDQTWTTARDDHRVSRKIFQLQGLKIHRDESTTDLVIVEYQRQHLPVFKLSDFAGDFVAPHLFVQRVEKLLTGRSSGKGGAVMFRSTETTEIE